MGPLVIDYHLPKSIYSSRKTLIIRNKKMYLDRITRVENQTHQRKKLTTGGSFRRLDRSSGETEIATAWIFIVRIARGRNIALYGRIFRHLVRRSNIQALPHGSLDFKQTLLQLRLCSGILRGSAIPARHQTKKVAWESSILMFPRKRALGIIGI